MPTRLIDVGHDASAVPRLVFSSNICKTERTRYAALSYCWGDEKDAESQFKTEKASLEDRCKSLPNELMTSTLNDAIAITRAIGLRYIWIDALCIIQDDRDDWSHESSQMNLVYRHAFVTLCSLNSNSCHESFLSRAPAVELSFQSNLRNYVKGSYLIRLRSRTGFNLDGFNSDHTNYTWDLSLSKWGKRCWTLQEQEMSTRLLLFGSLKMHFACARSQWTEGDEALRDRPTLGVLDQITRFKESRISARELYQYWDSLIDNYGRRSVTFDKDRLPAIAGLARMMGEALQDQYLAGLWKGDLLEGLMWHTTGIMLSTGLGVHLQNIRRRDYIAPSWSWAAHPATGTKRYTHQNLRRIIEEATIVGVSIENGSEDPYGQISGGFLRIRGKLATVPEWLLHNELNTWSVPYIYGQRDYLYIATDWISKNEEAGLHLVVAMVLFRTEPDDGLGAPYSRALLLHPAQGSKQYYRVGIIRSSGVRAYKEMVDWFRDSQQDTICII